MPDALHGDRSDDRLDDLPGDAPGIPSGDRATAPPAPGSTGDAADRRVSALADLPADTRATAAAAMRRIAPALGPDIDRVLAFTALLDRLATGDADDRLADLAAAQASGATTATDRALLDRLDARMASDAVLSARFAAFAAFAARLHAARPDPAAHFAALVAASAVSTDAANAAPSAPAGRPDTVPQGEARAPARRSSARADDRAPTARAHEPRMRWRTGVLAGVALFAVAFAGLRIALPPRLDLDGVARPEPSRSVLARPDAPRAAYDRAVASLAGAERTAWGVSLGLDRARVAAARAALDSVVAATPAASALHLDARFLRGAACEATADRACARRDFTAVVEGNGSRTSEAAARLVQLAR